MDIIVFHEIRDVQTVINEIELRRCTCRSVCLETLDFISSACFIRFDAETILTSDTEPLF